MTTIVGNLRWTERWKSVLLKDFRGRFCFDLVKKSAVLKGFGGQLRANYGIVKKGRFHNGLVTINGHFTKGLSETLKSFVSTGDFDDFFLEVFSDIRFFQF